MFEIIKKKKVILMQFWIEITKKKTICILYKTIFKLMKLNAQDDIALSFFLWNDLIVTIILIWLFGISRLMN